MKTEVRVDGERGQLVWDRNGAAFRFEACWNSGQPRTGEAEILALEPGIYSVLLQGKSYEVKIVPGPDGSWYVDLNGRHYAVELSDPREQRSAGGGRSVEGRQSLKSAMPGKVVRVLAATGDTVEANQGVVVVEAMKMQNEVKAARAGKVVLMSARVGATVAAGEVLAVIE